jgi:hypothetical protein
MKKHHRRRWLLIVSLLPAMLIVLGVYQPSAPESLVATLTRGPYLQSVAADSVIVVWETDMAGDSQVEYGLTASYGSVVSDPISVTHHALTLTGLLPHTTYHHRVSTDGQPLGADSAFRTAAPATQTTFTFVALGDTRTDHVAHAQVISSILTLAPDFVLHTGDFVYNGLAADEWNTFFAIEHDLLQQVPLFGALGNHELNSALYFDAFHLPGNERWYSFDYGNVHFVALQVDGLVPFASGSEQFVWLENDLAQTRQPWKVVFFHVPPYSSGAHGGDLLVSQVRQELVPLFASHDVDLVFNGHDHDYERSVMSGTVYIVTGGGGAPLYSQVYSSSASVYFTSTHHSVLVNVSGPVLSFAGVRSDGVRFDECVLYKLWYYLPLVLKFE